MVQMIELTQNMRQTDGQFADILNRVRVGQQTDADINVLQNRVLAVDREQPSYPIGILHIFATNRECDDHNVFCLNKLGVRQYQLNAVDSKRDRATSLVLVDSISLKPSETGGLHQSVTLAVGARVMVIANINVADGLSNGVIGTVNGIVEHDGQVHSVQVKFDNASVGKSAQNSNPFRSQYPHCVSIERLQANYMYGRGKTVEITRSQFPLALAFACTIHKTQGMTLQNVVISMNSRFGPGQAYVAMSRVRTLAGLNFIDFNANKIIVSKDVTVEMTRLRENHLASTDASPALYLDTGNANFDLVAVYTVVH
jgi:hypothetical protein